MIRFQQVYMRDFIRLSCSDTHFPTEQNQKIWPEMAIQQIVTILTPDHHDCSVVVQLYQFHFFNSNKSQKELPQSALYSNVKIYTTYIYTTLFSLVEIQM